MANLDSWPILTAIANLDYEIWRSFSSFRLGLMAFGTTRSTWKLQPPRATFWGIGKSDAYRPKGRGFGFFSSRHVGTWGKCFARSCLWRFGVKLRHNIRAVSEAPLSRPYSSGLEEVL